MYSEVRRSVACAAWLPQKKIEPNTAVCRGETMPAALRLPIWRSCIFMQLRGENMFLKSSVTYGTPLLIVN